MKNIFICSILLTATALVGCDKEIETIGANDRLEVKIAHAGGTKATSNLTNSDLYLSLNYTDNAYDQYYVKWAYDSEATDATQWTPEKMMLWKDDTTCPTIYAHSPAITPSSGKFEFTAETDQSTLEKFENSQLYGYKGSATISHIANGIELTLNRQMAILQLKFEDTSLNIAKVEVSNIYLKTTYTVIDATSVATDDLFTPCVAYKISDHTYQLVVAPGTQPSNLQVNATTDTGNNLCYNLSSAITTYKGQITPIKLSASSN